MLFCKPTQGDLVHVLRCVNVPGVKLRVVSVQGQPAGRDAGLLKHRFAAGIGIFAKLVDFVCYFHCLSPGSAVSVDLSSDIASLGLTPEDGKYNLLVFPVRFFFTFKNSIEQMQFLSSSSSFCEFGENHVSTAQWNVAFTRSMNGFYAFLVPSCNMDARNSQMYGILPAWKTDMWNTVAILPAAFAGQMPSLAK